MSTQASAPYLLRRVAVRAGVGMWRHRGGVLLAAAVCVALGAYITINSASLAAIGSLSLGSASGLPGNMGNADCADTAMAAIADTSPSVVQHAYQCMAPSFQQRVPEQVFVQQLRTQSAGAVKNVARIGDYHPPAGGTMVYYAVDTSGQSVGYIVYLGQDGKVLKIE
jgi:hypothetical protein